MLTIRLTRKGKKNQPFFKVVVIDKRRTASGGRAVEDLGYVDPLKKRKSFNKERILYWISKGAKPSPTIHNYLVSEKIIDDKKINVSKKSKKPASAEATPAVVSAPVVEAKPTEEAKPAEPKPSKEEIKPEEPKVEEAKPAKEEKPAGEEKPAV